MDKRNLAQTLKSLLSASGCTLSCAESCTGGNIAHKITSISGSSEYFVGGVVSYAAEVKENLLDVKASTIREQGIVSSAVAREMACGIRKLLGTTFSVATTGWADSYGDEHESAGTVWIAVDGPKGTKSVKYHSNSTRNVNISRFTSVAIRFLIDYISK